MTVPEDLTMGEIGRTLARLEKGQDAIASRLEVLGQTFVTRGEWNVRKEQLDKTLAEIHARRVPWTAVGSLIVAAGALLLAVLGGP